MITYNIMALVTYLVASTTLLASDFGVKIINGHDCDEQQFPDAVFILSKSKQGTTQTCSGTLIAPDVVLTAAHCVLDATATYFVTPQSDLSSGSAEERIGRYASHILAHHAYKTSSTSRADIGLIYLKTPLPGKPATIVSDKQLRFLTKGNALFFVGWGRRQIGPKQIADFIVKKQCAISSIDGITDEELEIGKTGFSPRKCFGDSGGGSYLFDYHKQKHVLVGISSHGAMGDDGCYTASYDIRVDYYKDWIAGELKLACQLGIRNIEYCHELRD